MFFFYCLTNTYILGHFTPYDFVVGNELQFQVSVVLLQSGGCC